MSNKYLEKVSSMLGVLKPKTVEKLVSYTGKMERGVAGRSRLAAQGFPTKPLAKSEAKLKALKTQSDTKHWTN